jgi:hypothetical protein
MMGSFVLRCSRTDAYCGAGAGGAVGSVSVVSGVAGGAGSVEGAASWVGAGAFCAGGATSVVGVAGTAGCSMVTDVEVGFLSNAPNANRPMTAVARAPTTAATTTMPLPPPPGRSIIVVITLILFLVCAWGTPAKGLWLHKQERDVSPGSYSSSEAALRARLRRPHHLPDFWR